MAPRLWDPYKVLNITDRDSDWMHCVGHVAKHNGARCRWEIPCDSFAEVISILDKMEMKPPSEISSKTLSRLASLSLCVSFHQNQRERILDEWEEEIKSATRGYEKLEKWKTRCKELSTMNKRLLTRLGESSKQKDSEDSEDETCVDEVSERLEQQLDSERQAFDLYRKDTEAAQKIQATVEAGLRFKLAETEEALVRQQKVFKRLTHRESDLKTECTELASKLAEERRGTDVIRAHLSAKIESLQQELSAERQSSDKSKEILNEAKRREETVLKTMESLQSQVADEQQNSYGLHAELKAARAEEEDLREQLSNERQNSDQLRKDLNKAEIKNIATSEEVESLRRELESDRQKSVQLSETFSREIRDLVSQLATQREISDQLDREFSAVKTENISLAAQLSNERQVSVRLGESLDQANTVRATLIEQMKSSQTKFETERQESKRLSHELDVTKTREAAMEKQLEEQLAVAAAKNAVFSAERARMLEQIANLERYSLSKLLVNFRYKLKSMMKSAVSCLAAGRWRRQIGRGDGVEQSVA
jgi:hypothetical protein